MVKPYYTVATLDRSNSIGFLVKRCGQLMTQIAERRFEGTSVSLTEWQALIWLSTQRSHISATQLSAELGHDMGALTRVVDELERRGFVRRDRSRRDRRAVEIAITPAGRREAQSAKRMIVELLNELVGPYSEAEIETLIRLLQRMLQHLQTAAAAAPTAAPPARASARRTRRAARPGAAA
ncbi:MAG TPA: MarR family winged helix-turn-helix transcriptional regulator [Steroidobacteraceae bacterium]|jgi:DNA-binding MarR family transcriptional regulator|nr:MarR family winged helix-turn-helix transcriptional regulator [Steroidobacteraceae bacterium]